MDKLKKGTVLRSAGISEDYHELLIEIPGILGQKPGQYIFVHQGIDKAKNAYSISSAPFRNDPGHFTITFRKVGKTTEYLAGLNKGDEITFTGPHGNFFLKEEETGPVYLFATGSGFSPIGAIISGYLAGDVKDDIYLWWQVQTPYHWERLDFWRTDKRFSMEVGTDIIDSILINSSARYYMAGQGKLLENLKTQLIEENIPPHSIHLEKFY